MFWQYGMTGCFNKLWNRIDIVHWHLLHNCYKSMRATVLLNGGYSDFFRCYKGDQARTYALSILTHWGRMTHICVGNLTIISSDNGLSPGRRQTIIWTDDGILLIQPLGTNFSEISIEILIFSFKKMRLKLLSAKWWPFCLNVLIQHLYGQIDGESIKLSIWHSHWLTKSKHCWMGLLPDT